MSFPCTSCGACCRRVSAIPNFPFEIKIDGSCEYLLSDNSCAIYEDRPLICRVDDYHYEMLSDHTPIESWHAENIKNCNQFIIEDGLDSSYLIPVEEVDILNKDTEPSEVICSDCGSSTMTNPCGSCMAERTGVS